MNGKWCTYGISPFYGIHIIFHKLFKAILGFGGAVEGNDFMENGVYCMEYFNLNKKIHIDSSVFLLAW